MITYFDATKKKKLVPVELGNIINNNELESNKNIVFSQTFRILRKWKPRLLDFDVIIIYDTSCFSNKYVKGVCETRPPPEKPKYLKFIKGSLNTLRPDILDYYDTKYNLGYRKDWIINKDGIILILLSNIYGIHKDKNIMKLNCLIPLVREIRKHSNNKIVIRPHWKNTEIPLEKLNDKYYKKKNVVIDRNEKFKHKLKNIKCVIADMTSFALFFGYQGIPIFCREEGLKDNDFKEIYISDFKILKDDNFKLENFKSVDEKYKFFNEHMNKLYFPGDERNIDLVKNIL